jgi:hypothetical protein
MDEDIKKFIEGIGARQLEYGDVLYGIVKRQNYFILNDYFLIVKIDHGKNPWWKLDADYLTNLNDWDGQFFLVLLVSANEGWVYGKDEINNNIHNESWKYGEKDYNYRIHFNKMKDANWFVSHNQFLKKIGIEKT